MATQQRAKQSNYEDRLISTMNKVGLIDLQNMTNTLQGGIWTALHQDSKQRVVVKVTNRALHNQSVILLNNRKYATHENVIKEQTILKYLSSSRNAPKSITKYIDFIQSNVNYYLVMEHGGKSLFQFVVKAHKHIAAGTIDIAEWHKTVKIIFKQMVECVEYVHSKNVVHFDISLENMLINDLNVNISTNNKIMFCTDDIQIKLCDFGLSEMFREQSEFKSNKFCGKPNYKSPEIHKKQIFDAKSNDIWGLGICLFMLLIGGQPWSKANEYDKRFTRFMRPNGLKYLLAKWHKSHLMTNDFRDLLKSMLQCESKRATIDDIKKSPILQ